MKFYQSVDKNLREVGHVRQQYAVRIYRRKSKVWTQYYATIFTNSSSQIVFHSKNLSTMEHIAFPCFPWNLQFIILHI